MSLLLFVSSTHPCFGALFNVTDPIRCAGAAVAIPGVAAISAAAAVEEPCMAVRRLDPEQPPSFVFTAENAAWAKATIAKYPDGRQASAVIPVLWRAQEQNGGWLSEPAMRLVADMLGMAYIRVYEIATFYTMFQLSPVGSAAHIQVCGTTPCMLRGSKELMAVCKRLIAEHQHELSSNGKLSWEEVECLGVCANAPMVQIWKDTYEDLTPDGLERIIEAFTRGETPKPGSEIGRTASCPAGGPTTLTDPALYDGSGVGAWQKRFLEAAATTAPAAVPAPAAAAPPPPAIPAQPTAPASTPAPAAGAAARPVDPRVAAAIANAGLAPDLEARSGGKPLSHQELERLKAEARIASAPAVSAAGAAPGVALSAVAPVKPALLEAARGGKGDDLTLLWGVAEKLQDRLNAAGIYHFDQIAAWTAENVAWFESTFEGFKGRVERDKWIEQAKKLATGWRPADSVGERPKG